MNFPGRIGQIGGKISLLCVRRLGRCSHVEERFRLICSAQCGNVARIVELQSLFTANELRGFIVFVSFVDFFSFGCTYGNAVRGFVL